MGHDVMAGGHNIMADLCILQTVIYYTIYTLHGLEAYIYLYMLNYLYLYIPELPIYYTYLPTF